MPQQLSRPFWSHSPSPLRSLNLYPLTVPVAASAGPVTAFAATGTVSGYKFNDRNADGEWDKNGLDNVLGNSDDESAVAA